MKCIEDANGQSRLTRRHLLRGLSAAALCTSLPHVAGAQLPAGKRLFTLQDAFRRTDLHAIVGSPAGDRWAVQVKRPAVADGLFGEEGGAGSFAHPRDEIWLADANLDTWRKISGARSGDWAPGFSPSGRSLAFVTTHDGAQARLSVRGPDGKLVHFAASPPCELAAALLGASGQALPFAWVGEDSLLYVADRTKPYQPDLMVNGEPAERVRAWNATRAGRGSVHVWSDQSETCGARNNLVRLDIASGKVTTLLHGDVRCASLSPDGRYAACLVADLHLPQAGLLNPKAPRYGVPRFDLLVQLGLQLVDLKSGAVVRVQSYRSYGGVHERELPCWSHDRRSVATVQRSAYNENEAAYQVLVATPDGTVTATHDASSQLDAEIVAHLVAASSPADTVQRLARRPRLAEINARLATSHVRRSGAWLYAFDGTTAFQLGPVQDLKLDKERQAPQAPTVLADGRMAAYGVKDGVLNYWTFDQGVITSGDGAALDPVVKPFAIGPRGQAVAVADSNDGTFVWSGAQERFRKTRLALNRHYADVAPPLAKEVAYKNARGEERTGILYLPAQHKQGERHPVVMWAYPDHKPALQGSLARLNGYAPTLAYPFLSLLAAGFAVFWAAFPVSGGREEPVDRVKSELFPAIDLLNEHPDIVPGQLGFFGHSNAGYVGLTLAGQTDAFKAIAVYSTFPDWRNDEFFTLPHYRWMPCGGFVAQSDRYFLEDMQLPYALGTARWNDEAKYARNTPLDHLHKNKTPMLFLIGEFDIGPTRMETAYHVVQANGVPAEFAYYRGESHVLFSPANVRDATERSLRWFRTYLSSG